MPLTRKFTDSQFRDLVKNGPKSIYWNSPEFMLPNNTQCVERCVKGVTEASTKVSGIERRNGYVRTTFASRSVMPLYKTKKDYQNV